MVKPSKSPLLSVVFRCKPCKASFSSVPGRVDDAPEDEFHPFRYFAVCPSCGAECEQAYWERNLWKAHANATGPRTPEGKAASAANLAGHPTPSEALRTRFNAMSHGAYARTATYFPARPGKYASCDGCDVDAAECAAQPACIKQTQIFMLHHAAFEQGNSSALKGLYADFQAGVFAVLSLILQTIAKDGVKITAPKYYTDKDGVLCIAEYLDEQGQRRVIYDIQAHPLFKPFSELLSRNGLSLTDMGMTAKVAEDDERAMGKLRDDGDNRDSLPEYNRRSLEALANLAELVQRGQARTDRDPVLIEYREKSGE